MALAQAGDGTGVMVLGEALDACSANTALCKAIIAALGKLRDPRAVPVLAAHLSEVLVELSSCRHWEKSAMLPVSRR